MQNKGFPADWLYQLKQKNNIVSVMSKYIHLEKKGGKYWACCPFHNEKNPSLTVNEDEGFFYCFGCKESGDVISFVQKYESCDFFDAVKILAQNAHMEIPEFTGDNDVKEKKQERERILSLLDYAYKHYQENLYLPQAKIAQNYVKLRGFTKKELDNFKLGFSIDWNEMVNFLRKKGFTYKEIMDAGIAQCKNNHYYDIFAGRLIFPIFNAFNECVGFSARVLGNVDYAKYINTAETIVFHKGKVVFGINLLKALKQQGKLDKIIIVEGQIDVIAMHRAGFSSTVACMGTALTIDNVKELKKISNKVVLCFDGDEAGVKATIKSLEILNNEGFEVKVATLPNVKGEHDPDEILKVKGKDALANIIENALPTTDFLINNELKKYDLKKSDERGKFAKSALNFLDYISSESEREPYFEKLRDLTNIPIDVLKRDFNKSRNGQAVDNKKEKSNEDVLITRENGNIRAIKFILSSLIYDKDFVDKKIDYIKLLPRFKDIIEKAKQNIPISTYYDYFNIQDNPILRDCIGMDFSEYENRDKQYFEESVWLLASQILIEKQNELAEKFKNCDDKQERLKIIQNLNSVSKALREKNLEDFYVR